MRRMDAGGYAACFDHQQLALLCANSDRTIDRLGAENKQLKAENAKLREENERLHSVVSDGADNAREVLAENAKLREDLEFERSENGWVREFLDRMGQKCGTKDCPSLVAYVTKLEAENAKLRRLVSDMWKAISTHKRINFAQLLRFGERMRELRIEVGEC